ncbi:MAG TPA: M23 family metallopeptidase [Dehalococcoidia bacterium]|nr:M23 family metallopeptidase [Dehalococcoidia bacterium]
MLLLRGGTRAPRVTGAALFLGVAVVLLMAADAALMGVGPGRSAQDQPRVTWADVWPPASQRPFPPPLPPATFAWPVAGPVSSFMDAEHPLGIDIGLASTPSVPVRASSGGVVSFAGGRACCSYGLYVVVEHPGGLTTLYAHLSEVKVREGEAVRQRQTVGISGSTGLSTSEHLHFEVWRNGERIDPLTVLPPRDEESIKVVRLQEDD